MLDLDRLTTPPGHGDVLIEPPADRWPALIEQNRAALDQADYPLLDAGLADVRRHTRARLADNVDGPLILIGHQPDFIHPGVWAKHVAADRVARRLGGRCVNLVVDNDTPKSAFLRVPAESDGRLELRSVRFAAFPPGVAFESIPAADAAALDAFEHSLRDALGTRFDESMMPAFMHGVRRAAIPRDWADQSIAGRRGVEAEFDVCPDDVRVSTVWGGPLLYEMLGDARRFAAAYNAALNDYRQARRIRDPRRPMPDLAIADEHCELPVWAYRPGQIRRRLFVEDRTAALRLCAEDEPVATIDRTDLKSIATAERALRAAGDYRLRPRALTLTLWARLLAGDLFVHGIGGAKYDQITDGLIRRYYRLAPPHIACVSATLYLYPARHQVGRHELRGALRALRDLRYNPQRHLSLSGPLADLAARRRQAVAQAVALRRQLADGRRRHELFEEIHELNWRMLQARPNALQSAQERVEHLRQALHTADIAQNRELFFAFLPRSALQMLVENLSRPAQIGG